jgi:putative tryptophan/tyrosine transport system substrate-binding protein
LSRYDALQTTGASMRRREVITLLGSAAAVWPLAARAQQGERVRPIGIIGGIAADDPDAKLQQATFLQGLEQLGWIGGRDVRIESRWTAGNPAKARQYAEELVALGPDVIFASGGSVLGPLLQASRTVPIVFARVADPVGMGFVNSLSRPGGNATGFMLFEYSLCGKWLALLKEIAPNVTRAVVLRDPAMPQGSASSRSSSPWRLRSA